MSCANQTITGIEKDCSTSKGGINVVYLLNYDDIENVTVANEGDTKGVITGITVAGGKKFHTYNFRKGTGSMTSTLNVDPANGVNYVTTDLALTFLKMDTTKRIEMSALAVNEMVAIVKDANNVYWYLGFEEPISATAGDGATGTARGDGNRYTITLQDTSSTFPYEVEAKVVEGDPANEIPSII